MTELDKMHVPLVYVIVHQNFYLISLAPLVATFPPPLPQNEIMLDIRGGQQISQC